MNKKEQKIKKVKLIFSATDIENSLKTGFQDQDTPKWKLRWWRLTWWLDDNVWYYVPYNYKIKDFWYTQISARLWPRQRWLTKQIPRVWNDKVNLIPDLMYAMIVHYVEGEKCFETICWDENLDNAAMIREIYDWAKTGKAAHEQKIQDAYPPISETKFVSKPIEFNKKGKPTFYSLERKNNEKTYEELYKEVDRLEAELQKIDDKYLTWIVTHRQILWV